MKYWYGNNDILPTTLHITLNNAKVLSTFFISRYNDRKSEFLNIPADFIDPVYLFHTL